MTVLDDLLASVTIDNVDDITAAIINRVDTVRKAAIVGDANLRAAIGTRVAALQSVAATATTDQGVASGLAASEAAAAAAVQASTPATTLAYVTQIRDQLAAIHTTLAGLETWRAQMDGGYALATTATADLATVVATKI